MLPMNLIYVSEGELATKKSAAMCYCYVMSIRPGMEARANQLEQAALACLEGFRGCVVGEPNALRVLVERDWPWVGDARFVRTDTSELVYIRIG